MCDSELTITPDRPNAERYWQLIPAWASKHDQTIEDIAFTMGCVKQFNPSSMIEIGVSTGVSSGALLFAANQAGGECCLDGVDISTTVYYDSSKRIGEVVEHLDPALKECYTLHLNQTAVDVASMEKTFDLAFIDGNHAHPWAAFDLLCILPRLAKHAVVICHDIHYFCPCSQAGFCLFESVPVRKAKARNIGCMVIDGDIDRLLEGLYLSFTMNWQDIVPAGSIAKVMPILANALGKDVAMRFSSLLMSKHDEYARSFPLYKYIRQQSWGREMEMRKLAEKYKQLLADKHVEEHSEDSGR